MSFEDDGPRKTNWDSFTQILFSSRLKLIKNGEGVDKNFNNYGKRGISSIRINDENGK